LLEAPPAATHIGLTAMGVAEKIPSIYADEMSLNPRARRRWFGVLCLLVAVGMMVAGETVLQGRLSPVGSLIYWITCFIVTALAAMTALLDAARVRAESRIEQRALIEETLRRIEVEKRARSDDHR
jgi:hypothetical protein